MPARGRVALPLKGLLKGRAELLALGAPSALEKVLGAGPNGVGAEAPLQQGFNDLAERPPGSGTKNSSCSKGLRGMVRQGKGRTS